MYTLGKLIFITMVLAFFSISCDKDNPVSGNTNVPPNDTTNGDDPDYGTVADAEGNVYKTVKIGNQIWTAADLRTTKFNDSTDIPQITDSATWSTLTTAAYCFYKNSTDPNTNRKYGALYNWYAINTKKLAPAGWHVPNSSEWDILRNYMISHGYNYDSSTTGNKIAKSLAAQSCWNWYSVPGTVGNDFSTNNKTGFNALPNGSRRGGAFGNMGRNTHYWCSNEIDNLGYAIFVSFDSCTVSTHKDLKRDGFAVRLVRDN